MKAFLLGAALSLLAMPAIAGSYRIVLHPKDGKMLVGHAGVQAVDDRTATALVRLISPGNQVDQRGTVRVLVQNLGPTPFDFGPEHVRLTLADGTVLRPSSVEKFEQGRELVERENARAGAVDLQTRNNVVGLEQQTSGGPSPASMAPVPGGSTASGASTSSTSGLNRRTDANLQAGAETLNGIYQILITQPVAPQKAWGGYYVFDVPKAVFARHADQPLSIDVRTGAEEHHFQAMLHWK